MRDEGEWTTNILCADDGVEEIEMGGRGQFFLYTWITFDVQVIKEMLQQHMTLKSGQIGDIEFRPEDN